MKEIVSFFVCINFLVVANAQSVTGHLSAHAHQSIQLEGFNGLKSYPISSTTVDSSGHFILSYAAMDYGGGTLSAGDESPFILILSGEDIEIKGQSLSIRCPFQLLRDLKTKGLTNMVKNIPGGNKL